MPEGGTAFSVGRVVGRISCHHGCGHGYWNVSGSSVACVRSVLYDEGKAGLGLGLAVSFGIIRRHRGNVEVESQHGQERSSSLRCLSPMSAMWIWWPTTANLSTLAALRSCRNRTHRVLVVDDEDFVRELLKGFRVRRLHSDGSPGGDEALDLLERSLRWRVH